MPILHSQYIILNINQNPLDNGFFPPLQIPLALGEDLGDVEFPADVSQGIDVLGEVGQDGPRDPPEVALGDDAEANLHPTLRWT